MEQTERWATSTKMAEKENEVNKASSPIAANSLAKEIIKAKEDKNQSVYDLMLNTKHVKDPWKDKKVNWINVIFTIMTYALIISDVPRAGAKPQVNLRKIGMGIYAYFGSYGYPMPTYYRDPKNPANVTAFDGDTKLQAARTWSFTYDTTSTEMRVVTRGFDTTDNRVLQCMNYEIVCDHMGTFPLKDTFEMMDKVIDTVASIPEDDLPQILPQPDHPGTSQHTRHAGVLKRRYVDILNEYLSHMFVESVEMISYRITHFREVDAEFDQCMTRHDRPYLCDAGPISDYKLTADPNAPAFVGVGIGYIPNAVKNQARATYNSTLGMKGNLTVDVTFFEGFTHPMTFTGGMVVAATSGFEIVKLTRVRDCTETECVTIRLEDNRFEGGRIMTDIDDWNKLVALLRISAQVYFIIRVITLFIACYYAFPVDQRSWRRSVFLYFSEIPSHIVAYGSPWPIFLYAVAMCIDGPIVNTVVQFGGVKLQGNWMADPKGIYRLICILMRRQWLLAAIAMVWVQFQVTSTTWDRHRGVLSVRGHIFGIISTMSMVLGYHDPRFRDSRVLDVAKENPDIAVLNIGLYARDVSNQKVSGVYSDIFSLLCCALVYAVWVVLVRAVINVGYAFVTDGSRRKSARVVGTSPPDPTSSGSRFFSGTIPTAVRAQVTRMNEPHLGIFFCRNEWLPSTCGTLWGLMGLTCTWEYDVFLSLAGEDRPRLRIPHKSTFMIMNIVQLSDPYNFLLLKTGFRTTAEILTYQDVETKATFSVAEDLEKMHGIAKERRANKFELLYKKPLHQVAFHELVQCR